MYLSRKDYEVMFCGKNAMVDSLQEFGLLFGGRNLDNSKSTLDLTFRGKYSPPSYEYVRKNAGSCTLTKFYLVYVPEG